MSDSYVGKVQGTPTLTTGQMSHLNLDTNGNLLVNIAQGSFSSTAGAQYNAAQQNFSNGSTNPLQADSHGQLLVNAGGTLSTPLRTDPVGTTTQPVSGTVGISGTVPVSGTFWQATQPVSVSALPALASGTNTIGNVQLTDGTNTANVVASDTGNNALVIARGRKEVSFSTTSTATVNLATTDVSNYSWVSVHVTGQGTGSVITWQGSNDNTNWTSFALMNINQASATPLLLSTTSAGSIYHGALSFRYFRLQISGLTSGTTSGVIELVSQAPSIWSSIVSLASGTATIGNVKLTDGTNTPNVKAASTAPVATDPALVVAISPNTPTLPVSIAATINTSSLPTTAGGLSSVKVISAASNNATLVKSTAGQVYNIQAFNTATSVRYLKLYNKTTAPAPATDTGSTVLLATYLIPANGSGLVVEISNGLAFSAGIGLAIVTGIADSDNTSTGASEVVCNLQFK